MVARRKSVIDLERLDDLPANVHSIVITFDDALQSFAENAVPILLNWKIPATVFAVADAFEANQSGE